MIELLVVISIIGLLSSVVLASLSSARTKANDQKIVSQLVGMRSGAGLYTGTGTAFGNNTCAATAGTLFETGNGGLGNILGGMTTLTGSRCYSNTGLPFNGSIWAAAFPLSSGWWCVDSTGASRNRASTTGTVYGSLDAALPAAGNGCM